MRHDEPDLGRFRQLGDAGGDAAFQTIWSSLTPAGKAAFPNQLATWVPGAPMHGLPVPLQDYLNERPTLPKWIDAARIEQAQLAFMAHESGARIVLGTYSLPLLYLDSEISQVLGRTGQLVLHVRRRLLDTLAFADAVMQPGSLAPGGIGWLWVRKIRLIHAMVRDMQRPQGPPAPHRSVDAVARLRQRGRMPLNQVQLALVLQTFGWVVIDGLDTLGWGMPPEEQQGYVYVWSAIGHLLGIEDELLPRPDDHAVDDARRLFERLKRRLLDHGDPLAADPEDHVFQGRLLVGTLVSILVQLQRERTPPALHAWLVRLPELDAALQALPRMLIRRLLGREATRLLRVPAPTVPQWIVCRLAMALVDLRAIAKEAAPEVMRAKMAMTFD